MSTWNIIDNGNSGKCDFCEQESFLYAIINSNYPEDLIICNQCIGSLFQDVKNIDYSLMEK